MNTVAILADPTVLRLESIVAAKSSLTIVVSSVQRRAKCPLCQQFSPKKHSSYLRRVADLPWQGVPVELRLAVHKFFCINDDCRRKVFAERLPSVVTVSARRTERLDSTFGAIAFALGGAAGKMLAERLSLTVSADTLLRRIRREGVHSTAAPRVVGLDDFAFRKRHTYGTILVDLETREPIDLLPDRQSQTVAAWLKAHPGIEIVSRDRAQEYAEGITLGAPHAAQVADRWHLLKNAVDVLKEFLNHHSSHFHQARQAVPSSPAKPGVTATVPHDRRTEARRLTRKKRLELYHKVQRLKKQGCRQKQVARQLGISKGYAKRLFQAETFPERAPFPPRRTSVDIYTEYLRRRWQEGCQNASQLWRELKEQGFIGTLGAVTRYVRLRMRDPAQIKVHYMHRGKTAAHRFRLPSARRAAWLFLKNEDELIAEEQIFVREMLKVESIARAVAATKRFQELVRIRDAAAFDEWLSETETLSPKHKNFVKGLRQDYAAVRAALETDWSNGQTEGQVNRLKLLKRQMYGRAKFDLLRARVLYRG